MVEGEHAKPVLDKAGVERPALRARGQRSKRCGQRSDGPGGCGEQHESHRRIAGAEQPGEDGDNDAGSESQREAEGRRQAWQIPAVGQPMT
jgi:hypothetical protein